MDTTPAPLPPIDFEGTLLIADMVRVLHVSDQTIRRRLQAGTFPIPRLIGLDNRLRWSGPVVKRWLERNGPDTGTRTGTRTGARKRGWLW